MKIKSGFHFIIKYEVYPFDLLVSVNEAWKVLEKTLKSKLPVELHSEITKNYTVGRTIMFSCGATCLRINEPIANPVKFFATLQHEIFHAVDFLMDKIGCKLSHSSDEAYAYMVQFITKKIYEKILC